MFLIFEAHVKGYYLLAIISDNTVYYFRWINMYIHYNTHIHMCIYIHNAYTYICIHKSKMSKSVDPTLIMLRCS